MMTGKDIENYLIELGIPPNDARVLAATAYGESGYNAKAELKTSKEDSVGLFQINMYAHQDLLRQLTGSNDIDVWRKWLQDPLNNIRAAVEVYKRRKAGPTKNGLTAWTIYTSGKWNEYVNIYEKATVKNAPVNTSSYVPDGSVLRPAHTPKWKQVWDDFLIKLGLKNDFPEQPTPEEELEARQSIINKAKKKGKSVSKEFQENTDILQKYVESQQDEGVKGILNFVKNQAAGTLDRVLLVVIGIACFIVGAFFLMKDVVTGFVNPVEIIKEKEGV